MLRRSGFVIVLALSQAIALRGDDTPPKKTPKPLVVTTPGWKPMQDDPLPPGAICRLGYARARHGIETNIAASADGKLLVAGFADHCVRIWEADSGKLVRAFKPLEKSIGTVAITPDGKAIAAASGLGIHLWEVAESTDTPRTLQGHSTRVSDCNFSADGKKLVSIGYCGGTRFWDVVEGKLIREYGNFGQTLHVGVAFALDHSAVVIATRTREVKLVKLSNSELIRVFKAPKMLRKAQVSADGKTLIGIDFDRGMYFWEIESGKLIKQISDAGPSAAISPDGKTIIAEHIDSSPDGAIQIHDVESGKLTRVLPGPKLDDPQFFFSPDSKWIRAVGRDRSLRTWDISSGNEVGPNVGHRRRVTDVVFSADGTRVVSSSSDGTVRFWDSTTGKELRRLSAEGEPIHSIALSDNGKTLAIGIGRNADRRAQFDAGQLRLWNLATEKDTACYDLQQPAPKKIRFLPEEGSVAIIGDRYVQVVGRQQGDIHDVSLGMWSELATAAVSPNGDLVYMGMRTGKFDFWDRVTDKCVYSFDGERRTASCVAFSPDGRVLAQALDGSNVIFLMEAPSGRILRTIPSPIELTRIAYSHDGRLLAAADHLGISLFEMTTGQLRRRFHRGHSSAVHALAFSPDSSGLVSGGDDGVLVVWDLHGTLGPRDRHIEPRDLDTAWAALADLNGEQAGNTIARLVACGKESLPYLRRRLELTSAADAERIEKLVKDLDDDSFKVRDRAARELLGDAEAAVPALKRAAAAPKTAEMRAQTDRLLKQIGTGENQATSAIPRRDCRAIEVIERIGTSEAVALLEDIRRRASRQIQSSEAEKALWRLSKRSGK